MPTWTQATNGRALLQRWTTCISSNNQRLGNLVPGLYWLLRRNALWKMIALKMLLDFKIFLGWWWWWWWGGCPQTSLQRIAPSTIAETLPRTLLKVWRLPSPPDIPPADGALDTIMETLPRAFPIVWALALLSSAAAYRLSKCHPIW